MEVLIAAIICIILLFSFVIFFGAPYLPTLKKQSDDAFKLLNLEPGQILLELGSGDGRILREAAKRGINGIGYEINPVLVWYSRLRAWRYRHLLRFECRNYWHKTLPPCDGIYVFLLDKYMVKLDKKIVQEVPKPVKVVSYAFKIPGRQPVRERNALCLYEYK